MAKSMKLGLIAIAALLARSAWAAYDELGVSARVTGLGNAFTAVADDVSAVHYNPAGLGTLSRPELASTYSKLLTGLSDNSNLQSSFLAYAHPLSGGRNGTVAGAWNYFTLDSLYRENTLYGSYGRMIFGEQLPHRLYAGGTLKYMGRSVGNVSAANNAVGPTGIVTPGDPDPVLQDRSKGNIDADVGVLFRVKPRWTVGLMIQHLLEPNIAFSSADKDKLGRNVKLGGAYKTPFATLASDVWFTSAPDGSIDKTVALAAEKWLPTLMHGTFGVRGGLAVGDRSFRQLAMGLSYKIYRLQFDYGFTMPLGGIDGTAGSHRLGLMMRFGRQREAAATFSEAMLENLRELAAVGTPEFRYQLEDIALYKRTAIEEFLRQAREDTAAGRFADAHLKMAEAAALKPNDTALSFSAERLKLVASSFPELKHFATDAAQAAIYEGALEFLAGRDKEAVRKLAYAQTLSPSDDRLEALLQIAEARTGVIRRASAAPAAAPTLGAEKMVGGTMALMEVALREREYDKVLKLAMQVIELDPSNALAYKRMGAAYYALKKYPEALRSLRSAYKLETDGEGRKQLSSYIEALSTLIERRAREAAAASRPAAAPVSTPQEVERLYEAGVDLYAQGRLAEAAATFRRILELEPANLSARRALDRVQAEILQKGGRP